MDAMLHNRLSPFDGLDVWQLLEVRARLSGDSPFFIWQPFDAPAVTWTYGRLLRDASAAAAGLLHRGVQAGDRVLIHLENSPEFVISWFACAGVGAVAVTTNTRSAKDELAYYADDAAVTGAVTQPRFADLVDAAAPHLRWRAVTSHDAGADADWADTGSSFQALLGDPDELRPRRSGPWAPMSVQYTSGTTSRPKGVLWTQANALWGARTNSGHTDLRASDCQIAYMPLFHTNALAYTMLASLWVGARFVLLPKWSTSRFWDISLEHGCTFLSLIRLAIMTIEAQETPQNHSYRLFGTGLCDLPFDARLGTKTIGWWGMTETISHPIVGDPHIPNRPLSMGRPAPEYEVKVVREDGVTPVEAEETGQLLVKGWRGVSMFAEYLDKPDATRESFDSDGWFRTGDLVTPHADGHISFSDRAKDMLKVGGENVAASEIERVIATAAGVHEVAVVSRPHESLAEVPVAFVVARDQRCNEGEVLRVCTELLADFKVPQAVYVVRALPRSTLNKVNKAVLRTVADPDADRRSAEQQWMVEALTDPSGDAR